MAFFGLIIFKNMTREHRGLFEIKSLFRVKNASVNSVVFLSIFFGQHSYK